MRLSYEKLWHLLLSRHMTKEALRKQCRLSSNTMAKLGKGENVTTDILIRICETLDCDLNDIVESVKLPKQDSIS